MKNKFLNKIMSMQLGAFSIRYWFVSQIIDANFMEFKGSVLIGDKSNLHYFKILLNYLIYSKKKKNVDILFISMNRNLNSPNKNFIINDYLFSDIITRLNKIRSDINLSILITGPQYTKNSKIEIQSELEFLTIYDYIKSIYISLKTFFMWIKYKHNIEKSIREQANSEILVKFIINFFKFKNILIYSLLGLSMRNAIETKKPKLIVSNDDCLAIRPRCNQDRFKLIVVQSANILSEKEACKSLIFNEERIFQPDIFLCSGIKFKSIIDMNRNSRKSFVTGQPRYDYLHSLLYTNKEDIKTKYEIESNIKILLFATQLFASSECENIELLDTVFRAVENIGNIFLIIKQHPSEREIHTQLIVNRISKFHIKYKIMDIHSDISEILLVSDILITRNSAAAREAVMLDKPVIIINLSKKPDLVEFVKEGIAIGVYCKEELNPAIIELLNNNSNIKKNQKIYIQKYLFKNDGLAAKRVLDCIISEYNSIN